VGQFAIQLAKLSGYKVVTVASPRNHEFLRGLGADAVFDVCALLANVSTLAADNWVLVSNSTGILT
jgi:NADPH:quinone reductase-like Zn-dependent oxidoreductase